MSTQTYPSQLQVGHGYTALGYLKELTDGRTGQALWRVSGRDAQGQALQTVLPSEMQGDLPRMSVHHMLQPLVQVATELVDRNAGNRIDHYALSLGLFAPRQLDWLIEVAASEDDAQRTAAIGVLAEMGGAWLRPEQRDAFVAALLPPLNTGTWTHVELKALSKLTEGDMPLLTPQHRQDLCDALSGALAKGMADRDDRRTIIGLLSRFLRHMNESQQEALVQDAIFAGIPGALAPGLQGLSRELRTTLFDAALDWHQREYKPAELGKLISGFAHLTKDQRATIFDAVLGFQMPDKLYFGEGLAAQWEHLSPGQRDTLLDTALDLVGRPEDRHIEILTGLGAVLERLEPRQQEAVVAAASSLPDWGSIYVTGRMTAAGMASLEESLRNRLVEAVRKTMADGNSPDVTYRGVKALLPALA